MKRCNSEVTTVTGSAHSFRDESTNTRWRNKSADAAGLRENEIVHMKELDSLGDNDVHEE